LEDLEEKIRNKTAKVGIVGLGYIGLPLALSFAEAGLTVRGFDIQQKRVDSVNKSNSYIADVSSDRLSIVTANGVLEATTDQTGLMEVDAICICVPTPLTKTKEPDLSQVIRVSEELSRHLKPGQLVVLESTTYPGTTSEIVLPILERSGLKGDQDFYLAYSPERIDPGNREYNVANTPKIVGGIGDKSTKIAELLYRQVAEIVIPVSKPEIAEMTKVFENVFRSVNIALVNELAQLCERAGISVWEVIDAASTKPIGYMPFYPGPGLGGHCIPLDPYYLASKARTYDFHTRFIELAAEINEDMPYHVVSRMMEVLNTHGRTLNKANVLVLGVAYKKNVADLRESPSLVIIDLLRKKGAKVTYNDPYIPSIQTHQDTLYSVELTDECLSSADCVLIATAHDCYNLEKLVATSRLIFDTRGITKALKTDKIIRLGE
jgi:UDP-N-acetyl-D-glucosamine dehydrogenase